MLATLPRPRSFRRVSALAVRAMLLEVAYRLHATKAVRRERDDRRRGGNTLSS